MRRTYLKWLSGAAFAGTMLLGLAGAAAENNAAEREDGPHVADAPLQTPEVEQTASTALDVQEAFEDVAQKAFAETFPQGKLSVVQREIFATAAVLTTAHRVALTGQRQRYKYRRALVYQAASRRALQDEHYAVAMYLSLHARAIGDSVIRANTSRYRRDYQPYDLDMIKRAGGVSSDVIVDYLKVAEDEVPAVRLLFTGGGVKEARN
ncbi:hypothetical protein FIV42_06250 [Persicimonas caeni]|uniref:Uncharacterized protein n=1 Tax=Persicimonas caeni TaxID=2292766 RepID=A0A4Y6PQQ5_PERCE|nr:hypothetical protein [Persicimonas caeni]QDG50347.1 hypothetical protein FIV42_06250 [Persicimonas caeni]QED31568.1 hypothetical protein FRD00_06245 [Persicimonas caeni]